MTENIERLLGLMRRLRGLQIGQPAPEVLAAVDLTLAQMGPLLFLTEHPGSHAQEVADGLGITPPSVSVALRKLEEAGWVERREDPDDKRAFQFFMSAKAQKMQQTFMQHNLSNAQTFLGGLEINEQTQLLDLFEKAIHAAEQRRLHSTQGDPKNE
jgi:DNA-binding MarR family transcriptional regulator